MTEKLFADLFLGAIPNLYLNRNLQVSIDPKTTLTVWNLWQVAGKFKLHGKLYGINEEADEVLKDVTFAKGVYDLIQANIIEKAEQAKQGGEKDEEASFKADQAALFSTRFNQSIVSPLSDLLLIELVDQEKKWIVYDEKNDVSHPYAFSVIDTTLKRLIPNKKVYAEYLKQNIRQCKKVYSPQETRFLTDAEGHECYNAFNKPAWMKDWQPDSGVKELPKTTSEFFSHLSAGIPVTFSILMSFLRDSLFSRAKDILILRGSPGCGKNMMIENLLTKLVGMNNYQKATRSFFESSFHGIITRCQVLFFDELTITDTRNETLKDWHNEIGSGDDKYVTNNGPVPLRCSIVCATNNKRKIHLKLSDRKFIVPTLNGEDLKLHKSQEWIDEIIEDWKNPETLKQIASYLYFNVKEHEVFDVKTPQFLELCWMSYPEYLKKFIYLAIIQNQITQDEFSKFANGNKRHKISMDTLRDQFEEFEVGNRLKVGGGGVWSTDKNCKWVFKSNIVNRVDLVHKREEYEAFKSAEYVNGARDGLTVIPEETHGINFQA